MSSLYRSVLSNALISYTTSHLVGKLLLPPVLARKHYTAEKKRSQKTPTRIENMKEIGKATTKITRKIKRWRKM